MAETTDTQEEAPEAEEQQPTQAELNAARAKLMQGVPSINIGALFMPAIWGPAHGAWITILYYPIWLLADNMFYGVYTDPRPITVFFAVLGIIALAGVTVAFARAGQQQGLMRALERGKTKEQYLETEKKWAVAMIIVAVIMLAAATYYNLFVRATLGA